MLNEKDVVIKWFNHVDTVGQVCKDIIEENRDVFEIFEEDGKEVKQILGCSNYQFALSRAKVWDYSRD